MILQGFVGPAYRGTSPNVAIETLHNWYPQTVEASEPVQVVYYPRPGLTLFASLPTGPVRALYQQNGRCFGVGGQVLYELNLNGVVTTRGTLTALDANLATICSNGTAGHQIYITSAGSGDIFDLNTNALTPITAGGYPTATPMGTYLDSYFLTIKGNSAQFNISNLLDGTAWSALDFAVRFAASDNLVGIIEFNKLIWLIGSQTSEPWFDSGAASFPYEPVPQVLIPVGCCAPYSIIRTSGSLCWLHRSERGQGIFVSASDYNPKRISTFALEAIWASYGDLSDAVTFALTYQGHEFVVLSFPSQNATFVYDFAEAQWCQWSWWDKSMAQQSTFRGWVHCQAFNGDLVGDWQTGKVYILDSDNGTDNGDPIIWERTSPHLKNEQIMHFYANFQLDMETGLGGSTPTALLNWSDDGGHTFNSAIEMPMGGVGEYPTRCRAAGNLGQSRDRNFRVRISNDVAPRLLGAHVDIARGTS